MSSVFIDLDITLGKLTSALDGCFLTFSFMYVLYLNFMEFGHAQCANFGVKMCHALLLVKVGTDLLVILVLEFQNLVFIPNSLFLPCIMLSQGYS